jgi:hypothetical protein
MNVPQIAVVEFDGKPTCTKNKRGLNRLVGTKELYR